MHFLDKNLDNCFNWKTSSLRDKFDSHFYSIKIVFISVYINTALYSEGGFRLMVDIDVDEIYIKRLKYILSFNKIENRMSALQLVKLINNVWDAC